MTGAERDTALNRLNTDITFTSDKTSIAYIRECLAYLTYLVTSLEDNGVDSVNGQIGDVVLDADDISDSGTTNKFATSTEKTKLSNISVTQPVDLDVIESDTVTNNAKVSNATHTGDVTGSTALTVDKTAITGKTAVTADGADYVLLSDTSDSGNLKKALVSDFTGSGGGLSHSQVLARSLGA